MLRHWKFIVCTGNRLARRVCSSPRTPVMAAGLGLGFGAWVFVQNFTITLGFTDETVTALLLAVSAAILIGHAIARRFPALAETGLATIVAATCLALLPSMTSLAMRGLDGLPTDALTNPFLRLASLTGTALFVAGFPAACGAAIVSHPSHRGRPASLAVSAALGLILAALVVGPLVGLTIPAFVIAAMTALVWIVRQWLSSGLVTDEIIQEKSAVRSGVARGIINLASMAAAGIGIGVLARVLVQLMPEAPYLLAAGGATLLVAVVAGNACRRRGWISVPSLAGALIAACGLLLPLAIFDDLVSLQLRANAYVSSLVLIVAIRVALVAGCLLPVGFGLGLGGYLAARKTSSVAAFCLGLAASIWLIPMGGVVVPAIAAAGVLVAANLPSLSLATARRWQWGLGMAATACLCVGLSVVATGYTPVRAAQLLFDANTLMSWKQGVPERLLTALDDTRLLSCQETRHGTLTAWRSRGSAVSLRLNGIPMALTSDEPELCPLPSAEVLRVVLPIMLHDDAESMLLLSDPTGLATEIALRFPLRRISSYDEIAFGDAANGVLANRPDDERLTCGQLDPRLALLVEEREYDIVVSSPGHPAAFDNAAYFTVTFYARAAKCLNPNGIFCQRVRFSDFGPEPLRVMARTMGEAFDNVMAVELGGGEIALLGTRGDANVLREGVTERLRRPQTRRVLADLGWDWSMPFNLKAVPAEQLDKFAREGSSVNTAMSGRLAHALPYEMMRWGPKGVELQRATSRMTTPLAALAAPEDEREEIAARIKAVARQHEMMRRYPDQPWAYRKAVRQHLKNSPRSVIDKVDGEFQRVLHPEEKRRLDYFKALGVAIREIDEPSLAELESYLKPYDPLISYFLHHEIAPLYGQLGSEGRARELAHRLHAAYFADPGDRSIRNIVSSINLLVDHPGLVSDPAERFDQLNGLVELLLARWEARGAGIPQSPEVALVDVDKSLDALVQVLPVMEKLAPRAGIAADQWNNRSDAIERMLNRPLRDYRATLLPHARMARQKAEQTKTAEAVPQVEVPL